MRKEYGFLFVIVIIAALFRLSNLSVIPPGLYPDEAMNGNNAIEALHNTNFSAESGPAFGWKIFYPENNGREGLFINIQAVSIMLFGNTVLALHLPSALFGIMTVLGIYFLSRELFKEDKSIAILAALILATSFWHMNFSRIGFRAIMAPFFMTWGTYFLFKLMNDRKILYGVLGGIVYGLGFHSYIAYRATPAVILFILAGLWLAYKEEKRLKEFYLYSSVFILLTVIAVAPLMFYFLNNPQDFFGRTSEISIFSAGGGSALILKNLSINIVKTLGMFNFVGDHNWRHNISGAPQLFWPVGILFIIGIVFSFRSLFRGEKRLPLLTILVWAAAALPVIVSSEGIPHALRSIIMIPPVILIASLGGISVYKWLGERLSEKNLQITAFTFAILLIVNAYWSYFVVWGKNHNVPDAFAKNYVEIAHEMNNLPESTHKVVVVSTGGRT